MTVLYSFLYEIPKPSQTCFHGKEPLAGLDYCSALFENQQGSGFYRQDYCLKCWEIFTKDPSFLEIKSHWKAKMPAKKEQTKVPAGHYAKIIDVLQLLMTLDTPEAFSQAYLLTLYLVRKRQLTFRQEIQIQGKPSVIYEVNATQQILCIKKIDPKTLEKHVFKSQLAEILAS